MTPESKKPFVNKKSAPLLVFIALLTTLVITAEYLNYSRTGKLINVNVMKAIGVQISNESTGN